jgi:hypothetical protein
MDQFNGPGADAYLKTEVRYVNYVFDRFQCDVQVQCVTEPLGNGASQYRYYFIGYNKFAKQQDTITWHSDPAENSGSIREKSLRAFKRGLLPFLLQTPEGSSIDYQVGGEPDYRNTPDPWNLWTMNVWLSGSGYGSFLHQETTNPLVESRTSNLILHPAISAWRISEKSRIGISVNYEAKFSKNTPETNYNRQQQTLLGNAYYVRSLSKHFSAGGSINMQAYGNNLKISILTPTIGAEYNVFSYDQYFKRRLLFGVTTGLDFYHFPPGPNATAFKQSVYAGYTTIQKWGFITTDFSFGHSGSSTRPNSYNTRTQIGGGINLNKNLLFTFNYVLTTSRYLYSTNSLKDIYRNYNASVGISYYFGSGYRSIVNPRMLGI